MDHAVKALMSSSPGRERLLKLNNDNARETSHLTDEKFVSMIESACVATVIEPALAFDHDHPIRCRMHFMPDSDSSKLAEPPSTIQGRVFAI
jgi:hypothetical protein